MAEIFTKRPLFPAIDENELLEFYYLIIGNPTNSMIDRAKKKNKFFTKDGILIRSPNSRLVHSHRHRLPLDQAIETDDSEFIDFLSVSEMSKSDVTSLEMLDP